MSYYSKKYEASLLTNPVGSSELEMLHDFGHECHDWEIEAIYNDPVTSDVVADVIWFKREADLTMFLLRRT